MPLHAKIDQAHLEADGLLLNATALQLVKNTQLFMQKIQTRTSPILDQQKAIDAKKTKINELRDLIYSPTAAIDPILYQAAKDNEHNLPKIKVAVFESFNALKSKVKSHVLNDFLDELLEEVNKLDLTQFDDVFMFYEHCYSLLEETYNHHSEQFPDPIVATSLDKQYEALMQEERVIDSALTVIKREIQKYKEDFHLKFEIDDSYQLTKISKRSEHLNFSVALLTDAEGKITPYALYRGKERILGSGGFGDVKLCQNLETGEWCALKIQQAIMRETSQPENAVLSNFARFKGQMTRENKYYSVQTLLPGVNLKKHLDTVIDEDLETRLLIAKQAITLINNFHEKYLHRDIKPENFMWDADTKELYLCDFGMACTPDSQGAFKDLSGSGTYLAPEIDDTLNKGQVSYTKKSDIYALGKTLAEVFEGVAVPSEISTMLESMTATEPNVREDNMSILLDTVNTALEELQKPSFKM